MNRRDVLIGGSAAIVAAMLSPTALSDTGARHKTVALVFDDYETLDLHGPIEMLGHMRNSQILLVGNQSVVRSYQGPRVVTDRQLPDVIPCDLFLIPGGLGTRTLVDDSELVDWLVRQCAVSKKVFSVCTGSALLAKTALLNQVSATTNKMAYNWVTSLNSQVVWQPTARWVDDGKYLTSSGVSAGIDAALHYIKQTQGEAEARRIEQLTEYQWNSDSRQDPYAISV
ncbi:DJ-1/PfpI family protein [Shewanella waksmanii]|uniref:DJ-1/PfpI family protein n=1 Tax=Shewanella waksmanii TaxID=213783 RepID=UPI000491DC2F|nr:DJ-1/PfpI family protein [Shewanella waksmanii]